MKPDLLHALPEQIYIEDYVTATYYLELSPTENPYEKARNMAIGQTVGTWLPVPGITEEMKRLQTEVEQE